jgi:hypothetical protein
MAKKPKPKNSRDANGVHRLTKSKPTKPSGKSTRKPGQNLGRIATKKKPTKPATKDGRSVKSAAHRKAISEGLKAYHAAKRKTKTKSSSADSNHKTAATRYLKAKPGTKANDKARRNLKEASAKALLSKR